ncbi:MAG: P-type conjugative transfer ATPase TrbB [Sedimenticola sp.]
MERINRLVRKIRSELGAEIDAALDDPKVSDIYLNDDGKIWIARAGEPKRHAGEMDPVQADNLIRTVASLSDTTVTPERPVVEARLPGGERFIGDISPITATPTFCIRKPARVVYSLNDYVNSGFMADNMRAAIQQAAMERRNILVVGGTGSGKTTLTNAILRYIAEATPGDRILIFEDTPELQCTSPDRSFKVTSETVDMRALLRNGMRQMPDRIIVGEVRGAEAEVVLKAWNTGHEGGVVTLHANSAMEGVEKFQEYVEEALPGTDKRKAIAAAVDLVVFMPKRKEGSAPSVREIFWLKDELRENEYQFKTIEEVTDVETL